MVQSDLSVAGPCVSIHLCDELIKREADRNL